MHNQPSVRVVGQKVRMQARKSPQNSTSRASPRGAIIDPAIKLSKELINAESKDLEAVVM